MTTKGSEKTMRSRAKNKVGYNSYMKKYQGEKYRDAKRKVFDTLGHVCVKCGYSDKRALQIDHVNGEGHKERRSLGGWGTLKRILLVPADYQILCANCNWIKRYENKEVSTLPVL